MRGDIVFKKKLKVAHLAQEITSTDMRAMIMFLMVMCNLEKLKMQLQKPEAKHDGHLLSDLHETMLHIDGYNANSARLHYCTVWVSHLIKLNCRLKLFPAAGECELNLAKTLMSRADFYLLDESQLTFRFRSNIFGWKKVKIV